MLLFDSQASLSGHYPSNLTLSNVTADGNEGNYGGGIQVVGQYRGDNRTTLTMIICKVTNNKGSVWGCGLYAHGSNIFLEGVMFKKNFEKRRDGFDNFS